MTLEILQVVWFVLVAVLILGFAILAGFDLGVGNLHLFTKNAKERENNFYAIGPFWDSNQVWLLTGGGALFAAFPMVYATAFSGFYMALMLLLLALITRVVSIEFQHLLPSLEWKKIWDLGFGIGSVVASILFGVAMGNVLRGLPLDETHNFAGTFLGLLNPYSIVVGLLAFAMFTMHGAAFLIARTEGDMVNKARRWGRNGWFAFTSFFIVVTIWSFTSIPRLFSNFLNYPLLFGLALLVIGAIVYYPAALKQEKPWLPFIASTINIVGLLGIVGASLFPYMIPATPVLANSLTIYNASSSQRTLGIMLVMALTGLPLVILYTTYVYRKFKKDTTKNLTVSNEKNISP